MKKKREEEGRGGEEGKEKMCKTETGRNRENAKMGKMGKIGKMGKREEKRPRRSHVGCKLCPAFLVSGSYRLYRSSARGDCRNIA